MIRQLPINFTYKGVIRHVTDAKNEPYVFSYERDGVDYTDVYACFEAFIAGEPPIKSTEKPFTADCKEVL
jgi:hypothetical protein